MFAILFEIEPTVHPYWGPGTMQMLIPDSDDISLHAIRLEIRVFYPELFQLSELAKLETKCDKSSTDFRIFPEPTD